MRWVPKKVIRLLISCYVELKWNLMILSMKFICLVLKRKINNEHALMSVLLNVKGWPGVP